MINKVSILTVVVFLFLALLSPGLAQAQSEPVILDSSAQANFPSQLSFSLSTQSNVNITDIRFHYMIDRAGFARVTSEVYIEFVPGTLVDAEWTWDMRKTGGLPPGSMVTYWWTVADASGGSAETVPCQVEFNDARYPWLSLTEGRVTIYWYQGDDSFARELMAVAQQALTRLQGNTGAYPEKPVKIYVYASAQDLQGAMIYPQEWTGGVAFTRYGTIAIGISPQNLNWGKRAIAHELTHLVIHQMTLNPYNYLPTWLDEGLAMSTEGALQPQFVDALYRAVAEDRLITVRSLSSPFSAYASQATLAYAQSYSLVEFLIGNYGQSKMLELLNTFREGSGYDAALEKVYGFDMDGLDALWREYIGQQYQPTEVATTGVHPVPVVVMTALITGLPLAVGVAVESRAWRQG
ncbi:MAG: peptidase MA domain-containing protein [Dehalococcoidales bacterium]|nr:peptidase MA domain-containing protein [Dehalococcoidales bacterium]